MKKYFLLLLLFCTPIWAGLGDPLTYTLPSPLPNSSSPPLPVPISPPRPPNEPIVDTNYEPLNMRLDALWGPKKVRVQNAQNTEGLAVLCQVNIANSICQANFLQAYTDRGELTKSPLDRLNPSSYIAVGGFDGYFDLQIQGNTPCTVDMTCEYVMQRTQ